MRKAVHHLRRLRLRGPGLGGSLTLPSPAVFDDGRCQKRTSPHLPTRLRAGFHGARADARTPTVS